jgi:hypothetical protein
MRIDRAGVTLCLRTNLRMHALHRDARLGVSQITLSGVWDQLVQVDDAAAESDGDRFCPIVDT